MFQYTGGGHRLPTNQQERCQAGFIWNKQIHGCQDREL